MFAIRQATGKGLGVFASQQIRSGQRILSDRALLTISASKTDILSQVTLLPKLDVAALLGLSQNPAKSGVLSWLESIWRSKSAPSNTRLNHTILNIFRNNNFDIGDDVRALFPRVARLNHSCVPNAQGNFNRALDKFTVHATSDIQSGEEITISYLDDHLALRANRQSKLLDNYGFVCGCRACDKTLPESAAREARRAKAIDRLEKFAQSGPADAGKEMDVVLALLNAYQEEGIRGREIATMYMAAASQASKLGFQEKARELALAGLKCEVEAVGGDSPFFAATEKQAKDLGVGVDINL
ncbi:TPR domain-containing protein [Pseudovirgaria hyperparasitica]|uniref:TPR domain-containing protein n=1 Tax=Pseudovirgaria hyperparasitica TaxID=470096 RepID=A0A6A6VVK5_9PEZI|nr:TPR domain-containing protein [Pseudovirgaria hyperparasitica]KAF2754718.1 TPR domain-containing protein [Pseudovirgaria hyperparasitica]